MQPIISRSDKTLTHFLTCSLHWPCIIIGTYTPSYGSFQSESDLSAPQSLANRTVPSVVRIGEYSFPRLDPETFNQSSMNFETRKDDSYPSRTDGVMGSGGSEMIMSAGMMDLDQEIMNDIIQAGSGDGSISHWIGMTSSGPTSLSLSGNSSGNGGGTYLYPEEIMSESPPASHMELPAQPSSSTAFSFPRIRASPPSLSLAIPDSTLTTDVNSIMGTGPSLNLIQPTPNSATPRRKGKGTLELERVLGELVDMESASVS